MPTELTEPPAAEVPLRPRAAPAGAPAEAPPVRVSVVIPTLNEEKRIGGLLRAFTPALRRRFGLEVVVSDGGSTDRTLAIARALADRVVVHRGPERQTIAAGRNAGAEAARASAHGGALLFFNADVRLPDDVGGFLADLLRAAESAGAATCRVGVHPSEATWADRLVLGVCNGLFCAFNYTGAGMGRGECHAVRADVFRAVGGYNAAYAAGEDFDLFNRIARSRRARIRFLWGWTVWEDPRRYRHRGYARTLFDWFRNTVWITFRGRAHSQEWEPVR